MSIPCKFERSVLSYDEHEIVLRSHHPGIYDAGLDDLKEFRRRLRNMHKQRTLARESAAKHAGQRRREAAVFRVRPNTLAAQADVSPLR